MYEPEPDPMDVSCDVYDGPWPQAWAVWTTIAATFGGRVAAVLLGSPAPESVEATIKAITDARDEGTRLGRGQPVPVVLTLIGDTMVLRYGVGRSWARLGVLVRGDGAWSAGVSMGTSRAPAVPADQWAP